MPRYWIFGEFANGEEMLAGLRAAREAGYTELDAYSPYPVHGVPELLDLPRSPIAPAVFCGGLFGAVFAYLLQWWCNALDYPINVGGRPLHGPASNIPITFELMVLFGSFTAFFGVFIASKLPRYHHPVFELDRFRSATVDRFWVTVCTAASVEERALIQDLLRTNAAISVHEVADTSAESEVKS